MAEQYEEAIIDATEDTLFRCLAVIRDFDMAGYSEGHFNEMALKEDILTAITSQKGEVE